jgi:hypothetical protein
VSYLNETFRRIRQAWVWVAAQFWATLLIVLAGAVWTRLPERHVWQVGLTLLVPMLMLAAVLVLEAGTMRGLFNAERRVHFAWGALTLLVWIAVIWVAWTILDWCDDQTFLWAGYLNSRISPEGRSTIFTFDHIAVWLGVLIWIIRWIAVPAKVIPWAMASAQWGWRLPWRGVIRLLWNWRWWLGAAIAALAGVYLPGSFFNGKPHGTVSHQVWAVVLKSVAAYLLPVASWVLLLAWAAVLLKRGEHGSKAPGDDALVAAPVGSAPRGEDSVKLRLPESGDDLGGNL